MNWKRFKKDIRDFGPSVLLISAGFAALIMALIMAFAAEPDPVATLQQQVDSLTGELDGLREAQRVDTLVLTPWEYRDSLVAEQARKYGVPEELALAVSHVENWRGLPWAQHPGSKAYGLMQVMRLWEGTWPECGDPYDAWDPEAQACYGVRILGHYLNQNRGNTFKALAGYNGAETPWKAELYNVLVAERKARL